ncbi:uracil-DNA glycosylase [Desulfobacter hydrogenophilus]|uniref:Uracil-DNA glycosylase n=1 Tax=Desulfobacter hydrogenophilus TaxID=2291 RepID=A0A328FGW6_9BACT|nr:uracil-DNA glycosylase [Desulfobacter hydrogenophilus]NDY71801.1 uracil-DNA glycosylase [Desulfobacter hydrogenophilus]QBH13499.1 uracil-DNA glycosylase [Desulfobacter hydrogenophilus]RAM03844.1 uracil-DNA glycosylase [Desulfobacter hydrogenophilus]
MDISNGKAAQHSDCGHGVVQALNALSRFLKFQKSLGNQSMTLGRDAFHLLDLWGTPSWPPPPFVAQGPEDAKIVLVDSEGSFFNGQPGNLLVKMLSAMHLAPSDVYICNAADNTLLTRHILVHKPIVVVALGEKACRMTKGTGEPLAKIRGDFFQCHGVPVMATHHPGALLKNSALKRQAWDDLKQVMAFAGLDHHDS